MAEGMTLEDLARRFDDLDRRFDKLDGRLDKLEGRADDVDRRFDKLDGRVDDLKGQMIARFDETHRLIRMGLEGQEILKESMERRFDAQGAKEDDRYHLLTAVARHLRVRVEAVESSRS